MNTPLKTALAMAGLMIATQAAAQITFYEHDGFAGRTFTTQKPVRDFSRFGFNDRASSVVVARDRWEVCEDPQFGGTCVVLRAGSYPSLSTMGLNDRVSSVRNISSTARVDESRYSPAPVAAYGYQRRSDERTFEADVTSVRAVVATPQQRCWVDREQVSQERSGANVPGAIVGAILGGVIGHQVGSGRGNDVATAGGAVVGGVVGANVGRDRGGQDVRTQDVQRCENAPSQSRADYWDVTYNFRGQEHRVQMTTEPGRTVTVNAQGEPRA